MDKFPILKRKSKCTLDKYKEIIIDNIDKKMTDIFEILKKKGYKGKYNNLKYYVKIRGLKVSTMEKNIFVNRTNIIDILYHKGINDLLLNNTERENLKLLLKKDSQLSNIVQISDEFYVTIFSENSDKLDKWIEKAKKLNISELNKFISTIEKDIFATKNAIEYLTLSNGLIEGKNCKMKHIKRMMYGRCSYKLLKAKLIQLG